MIYPRELKYQCPYHIGLPPCKRSSSTRFSTALLWIMKLTCLRWMNGCGKIDIGGFLDSLKHIDIIRNKVQAKCLQVQRHPNAFIIYQSIDSNICFVLQRVFIFDRKCTFHTNWKLFRVLNLTCQTKHSFFLWLKKEVPVNRTANRQLSTTVMNSPYLNLTRPKEKKGVIPWAIITFY